VCPDYLTAKQRHSTRDDLNSIYDNGGFKRAGVGHGSQLNTQDTVRHDEIHWLERGDVSPAQLQLWKKIDSLKRALNRTLYLGLTSFEGHYAIYPKGGFYARHLDRFHDGSDRVVSFILYLNQDWQTGDGGRLRIYDGDSPSDIDPHGGTMVCFLSADSEHEVLVNYAPRFSFSGWFKS